MLDELNQGSPRALQGHAGIQRHVLQIQPHQPAHVLRLIVRAALAKQGRVDERAADGPNHASTFVAARCIGCGVVQASIAASRSDVAS